MLRDLVNGHAGIYFGDEALPVLERRLRERLLALGLKKYSEYYQFLQFSSSGVTELDEAIDLLTTNETYFFREDYQLRAFGNEVLPRSPKTRPRGPPIVGSRGLHGEEGLTGYSHQGVWPFPN